MKTNPRIYLSGPITGVEDFANKFDLVETELGILGFDKVINPSRLEDVIKNSTYEEVMNIDIKLVDMCDLIVMLPGWKKSLGCNREYGYALGRGIPVVDWESRSKEWRV